MLPPPPTSALFPYTTLFRSKRQAALRPAIPPPTMTTGTFSMRFAPGNAARSEEHTSELQSLTNLVCRLLLEKKNDAQPRDDPAHVLGTQQMANGERAPHHMP